VVYDSQNGHYLWRYFGYRSTAQTTSFIDGMKSNKEVFYADAAGLVDFVFPARFFVKAYTLRADSLDAAESASINEIQQGLAKFEGGYHRDYKEVDLTKAITTEFRCLPDQQICQDQFNTIVSIGKQGSNWRLVLRNRWDQEIILDSNFNPVSTQRLTPPK
jgi:hypothetical protein